MSYELVTIWLGNIPFDNKIEILNHSLLMRSNSELDDNTRAMQEVLIDLLAEKILLEEE